MSSSMGGMFLTVFTTAALGVVVYYLLQRLKVTEAHLALLDRKSRQNVDIGRSSLSFETRSQTFDDS